MIFFWKIDVYSQEKIQSRPFWALFGPNLPRFGPKSTFWLISSKQYIEFCLFCVQKLILWSSFGKLMFTVQEKSSPAHFGLFLVQICPFQGQNQHFGLYLLNCSLNFADFLYRNYSNGLLLENLGLQSRKFSSCPIWALFGPNLDLFGTIISLKLICDLGLDLSIVIVYIF